MRSFAAASIALALASFSVAQIDPNSVDINLRRVWCQNQIAQCPQFCSQQQEDGLGTTRQNFCTAETLSWACVCQNGQTINGTEFSQTVPFYICQTQQTSCRNACGNDACRAQCLETFVCGATDPTRVNTSTISTTATATGTTATGSAATTTANFDSLGAQPSGSNNNQGGGGTGAAAGLSTGRNWGVATVITGFVVGFGLLL